MTLLFNCGTNHSENLKNVWKSIFKYMRIFDAHFDGKVVVLDEPAYT